MKLQIICIIVAMASAASCKEYVVTAFCGCAICCGKANQPTACGKMPKEGVTIAAPRAIKFGTVLDIQGVGKRTVQDRLAKRYDDRIDVFFKSHKDAKKFGIKRLEVK